MSRRPHKNVVETVVWVTGAGRGIGKAIAKAFASIGAKVVVSSRTIAEISKTAREIRKRGGKAISLRCDVASEKSVRECVARILKRFGRIDVLVNNAGAAYFKPVIDTTASEFDETVHSNLRGLFLCTRAVLPTMIRERSGHIFNVLSVAATTVYPGNAAYGAAKAGALMFTKVLRKEVRRHNIKVVGVLPGATETMIWDSRVRKKHRAHMMQPEDISSAILVIYRQSPRMMTEEITLRPIRGDL